MLVKIIVIWFIGSILVCVGNAFCSRKTPRQRDDVLWG